MKKLAGVLLVVLLGACDAAPERITAPEEAQRGPHTYGGGNRNDNVILLAPDTLVTTTTQSTSGETPCMEERGGFTYGSGNRTDDTSCSGL